MRILVTTAALLLTFSTASFAKSYHCEGVDSTTGEIDFDCTGHNCTLDGELNDGTVSPEHVTFKACKSRLDAEPDGRRSANYDYYDVITKKCWATYVRVKKEKDKAGNTYISVASDSGGDTHDSSGYQYFYTKCAK